jgi:ParB-like chromosome segregation protein Spo0J
MALAYHPLAELFPPLPDAELFALAQSIRESGLREPIVLYQDKILDGRNRYRACALAAVTPTTVAFNGGDPVRFVIDANLHRRHLTIGQRALIAARLATLKLGANQHSKQGGDISSATAARLMNVSRDSVNCARKVLKAGTADEIKAVESGAASPKTLARQLRSGLRQDHRARRRAQPISEKGRNPERIQNQRIESDIWRRLRDALDHLTNLPLPSEVSVLVRNHTSRAGFVGQRLTRARKWLEEFDHAWHRPDEQDAA